MFQLMNVNSGGQICDAAVDANTYTNTEGHLIGVIGSGEGGYSLRLAGVSAERGQEVCLREDV
jgi:hypothetical protein